MREGKAGGYWAKYSCFADAGELIPGPLARLAHSWSHGMELQIGDSCSLRVWVSNMYLIDLYWWINVDLTQQFRYFQRVVQFCIIPKFCNPKISQKSSAAYGMGVYFMKYLFSYVKAMWNWAWRNKLKRPYKNACLNTNGKELFPLSAHKHVPYIKNLSLISRFITHRNVKWKEYCAIDYCAFQQDVRSDLRWWLMWHGIWDNKQCFELCFKNAMRAY